jgi:circadian clock protein KaiC
MKFSSFHSFRGILKDGIPEGDQILVSGPPGSGKSIMAMQFLMEGVKAGERGIFFTLENRPEFLVDQMEGLGLDVKKAVADGNLEIVELQPNDVYVLLDEMGERVKKLDAKRIVLDSLSVLAVYCGSYRNLPEDLITFMEKTPHRPPIAIGEQVKKQMLYHVLSEIRRLKCTTILISELAKSSKFYSRDTVSEFACDGLILLDYNLLGAAGVTRTLSVIKMRRCTYSEGMHEISIGARGIKVH